jgi:hypothetical protein
MARRLLAFALAFVIIGGPLAADVCEAACPEHAGHSIDSTVPPSYDHHSAEVVRQPWHHHHSDVGPGTSHEAPEINGPAARVRPCGSHRLRVSRADAGTPGYRCRDRRPDHTAAGHSVADIPDG